MRFLRQFWCPLAVLCLAACAFSQSAPAQPSPPASSVPVASAPAGASKSSSAASSQAVDPEVLKTLLDMQAAGDRYKTIRADINYLVESAQTGDEERRTGYVAYQAAQGAAAAKFRISFDTLQQSGGAKLKDQLDYVFDGQWLTVAKHRIKQMTRYQVAAPGEKVEPLRLGKGPFPVPFGQQADDVLAQFSVTTAPPTRSQPPGTVYLKLVPLRAAKDRSSAVLIEMWVDPSTALPVKIVSEDRSENVTTVTFDKVQTGAEVDPKLFVLDRPTGWEYVVKPLE